MIYFKIDTILLSIFKDAYAVGIYGTPYRVLEVILTVPTILMSSVFPVLTTALRDNRDRAVRVFQKAFDVSIALALPIGMGVLAVGTQLMVAIAGAEFAPSGLAFKILIWATSLSFLGAVFNYTLIAAGRQRQLMLPYLAAAIVNIVLNVIFIPTWSYLGASVVTVITEVIVCLWAGILVYRQLHLRPGLLVALKAATASIMMFGALYWLTAYGIIVGVLGGVAVYGALLLAFKTFPKDFVKAVFRTT